MQSNLAYIDDVIDREASTRIAAVKISDAERAVIRKKAMKPVAGFLLHDEEAERKMLDETLATRRAQIEVFVTDRTTVRTKLSGMGVPVLAVVPTKAWNRICRRAGLYRLSPNSEGRVGIDRKAFDGFDKKSRWSLPMDEWASKNWRGMLDRLFPDGFSVSSSLLATLILPEPPEDIAQTLLKAASLPLKVAVVAEAIRFSETMSQLKDQELKIREEEKRAEELRRLDPIIYTEQGTASAVIAQFGDFPIEKDIVDAVVASDDFVPDKPAVSAAMYGANDLASQYMQVMMRQQNANMLRQAQMFGGINRQGPFFGLLGG